MRSVWTHQPPRRDRLYTCPWRFSQSIWDKGALSFTAQLLPSSDFTSARTTSFSPSLLNNDCSFSSHNFFIFSFTKLKIHKTQLLPCRLDLNIKFCSKKLVASVHSCIPRAGNSLARRLTRPLRIREVS